MTFKKSIFIIALIFYCSSAYAEYINKGVVETIREDGYITVLFNIIPDRESYNIRMNEKIIGTISSLRKIPDINEKKRYLCTYLLFNEEFKQLLRPGLEIVLKSEDIKIDKILKKELIIDSAMYKSEIISPIDNREMVFIPEGKFLSGCSSCDRDEYPEHTEYLDSFYIDKFEVSNRDFKKYADLKGLKYPEYWNEQIDNSGNFVSKFFSSLPVIVSYYEAADYALWAGKRLPVESEWEKASRPPLDIEAGGKRYMYSFGSTFRDGFANTEEFWLNNKTGEVLKNTIIEKYGMPSLEKGYIPVDIYEKESLSYYGAAHLDGNALEWTESWYKGYPGNKMPDKKYGEQYKVIRGGAYFLSKIESRITDRKPGGMPDLYNDRIAGFRCVKSVAGSDKK